MATTEKYYSPEIKRIAEAYETLAAELGGNAHYWRFAETDIQLERERALLEAEKHWRTIGDDERADACERSALSSAERRWGC